MDVEITPEPTEDERAAIAVAVADQLASTNGSAWWLAGLPDQSAAGHVDDEED